MPKLALSPNDRKAELKRRGITGRQIARQLAVGDDAVSHVLAGRSRSERIETAIAEALGLPVEKVFPPRRTDAAA